MAINSTESLVICICACVGALVIVYYTLRILLHLLNYCCCRRRQNLLELYGNGERGVWAVVTGGSDGIGLELCHQLAEQGFNICMMARNKNKMDEKLAQIKEHYPLCETKAIVADFS